MVEKWIHDLGGTVLTKDNAETIIRRHSKTPNCFLLLKDDKDLVKGTMTWEERLQNRVAKNESTIDLESSDTGQKPNKRAGKKELSPAAIQCRKFASSDFKVLKLEYLVDSLSLIQLLIQHLNSYIRGVIFQLFKSMTIDQFWWSNVKLAVKVRFLHSWL